MQHLPKYYKWIFFFTVLLAVLSIVTPALADYLGPNRTVTTTVKVCKVNLYKCTEEDGKYKDKKVEDWRCSNESKPWDAYPSHASCHSSGDVGNKHWERDESTETITTVLPSATIAGSINCTVQNGWCNGGSVPELALSAHEPVSGHSILLIEGTLNGASFACQNGETNCNVPLEEGDNNFNYWALSSWGDSSVMGNSAARVDTVAPNVGLDISGVNGTNGWYVSATTVTATGSDATSGVASVWLDVDGGAPQASVTLNEGVYQVNVEVIDNAGNASRSSTPVSVDTTTPTINMSVAGTAGHNGWYRSGTQVSAIPADATSGVAAFEVAADGGAYQNYTAPVSFGDGYHTIQFRAVDVAGNRTETSIRPLYVDTVPPTVELPASWQLGRDVSYTVRDEGSGLAAVRIVIEDEDEKYAKVVWDRDASGASYSSHIDWDGQFKDKTVAPPGTYLMWIKARDMAGNERFQLGKVVVPEPNVFLSLLPTEELAADAVPPAPPAELSDPDAIPPVTASPALDFGGGMSEPGEATTQSVLLATGSGGAASTTTTSGILWGAAAAAAIAAATTYALDVTRKRLEAEEAQAERVRAEIARDKAEHAEKQMTRDEKAQRAEEHDEKVKERKERQEWANPAKEKALLKEQEERDQAYQEQLRQQQQLENQRVAEKLTKLEEQQEAQWQAEREALKKKQEEAASKARMEKKMVQLEVQDAGWVAAQAAIKKRQEEEQETPSEPANWWETTKSFVKENVIDPVNEKVIQPYVKPYVENQIEKAKNTISWVDEKVIQPYVKPYVENQIEKAKNTIEVVNEKVIQPYVKPYVENQIEKAKNTISWVNEKVVQPYVVPAVTAVQEKSWWQKTWEEVKDAREKAILWVDQHQTEIALGIGVAVGIAAIVLSGGTATPLVAAAWVAGAAAVAAGAIAIETVALNVHYGREWHENLGRNIAISALSAAAVAGAWFIFQAATTAAGPFCYTHQAICGRIEPVLNALDWGEEAWLTTKMAFQTWTGNQAAAAETALELQMERMDGGMPGNSVAKELGEETLEKVAKYGDEALGLVMLYGDDAAEIIAKYGDDGVAVLQKYGDDAVDLITRYKDDTFDFVKRAEKLGVNPTDILDNPPLPGQTLEGWLLKIDDPENPVNMPLKFNLPDTEIDQLMRESIQNPDSKLFSIGYGKDAKIPFDKMANQFGDEYKMSFVSMPDSKWTNYNEARAYGDFWEVNSEAIEWGIEERKIFVLNVDYDLAADASNPSSTRRFTYAELKLIENPANNYTLINNGEYSFFVPNELLDTYEDILPPELLTP